MKEGFVGPRFKGWTPVIGKIEEVFAGLMFELVAATCSLIKVVPVPMDDITNAGNVSFRTKDGCVITRSGCDLARLRPEDLVEVIGWDLEAWTVVSRCPKPNPPSSETLAHLAIYQARTEINAIFHLHSSLVVQYAELLGMPLTERDLPYGTKEFTNELLTIVGSKDIVGIDGKRHIGFFAFGVSIKTAKEVVTSTLAAIARSRPPHQSVLVP